jgi:hypothetical protein
MEDQTLFILENDGTVTITPYAKEFYKSQGLDPKQMADEWEQRIRTISH